MLDCSTGWGGSIILGEQVDQDLLTQKGSFSQDLFWDGLQPGLYQVLLLELLWSVAPALLEPSDVAEETIFSIHITGGAAALFIGLR